MILKNWKKLTGNEQQEFGFSGEQIFTITSRKNASIYLEKVLEKCLIISPRKRTNREEDGEESCWAFSIAAEEA